ncbi:MAG: hypothetical protein CK423_07175 [Legionella sp.]|nr:MAG: hypothetical protein CK423_07175 [Legionella sp.]
MSNDLYEVLGVSVTSTTEDIKKAYRKKVLRCHPDKTSHLPEARREVAEAEFKKINYAHEVLSDPEMRKQYDDNGTLGFDSSDTEEICTYEPSSKTFAKSQNNGRLKLEGASKTTVTYSSRTYDVSKSETTLVLAKDSLNPMLERFNHAVELLNNKTFKINDNNKLSVINKKYENVTNKVNGLYYEIMANMDALRGNLINHDIMIRALRASQEAIKEAQKDGEFANHRGFMRNTSVLNQVCVCLDLILNFLGFLEEKIQKKLNHDQRPIYKSMEEFKLGMFKPAKTSTARNIDDLSTDIDWYIKQIENEYRYALSMGA